MSSNSKDYKISIKKPNSNETARPSNSTRGQSEKKREISIFYGCPNSNMDYPNFNNDYRYKQPDFLPQLGKSNSKMNNIFKVQKSKSNKYLKMQKSTNSKQMETMQSHRSVSSCKSHRTRKMVNYEQIINTKQKLQRPQSAMIKKSRKRSWQIYNTKIPMFRDSDILFKKDQNLDNQFEECVGFLKTKFVFVKICRNRDNLEWEPISNEYIVKILGRVEIKGKNYFVIQNFNKTSIRDIIDSFGPCKQSLVKKQIRGLVCGVIHCHNRGIIHNRLNPDTIFMNKQGHFLIDIAKSSEKTPTQNQKSKYYHYFAPELLTKGFTLQSCDVWAIGCLTLEMLTGKIKTSALHPYNQGSDASPSSNEYLKKLIQQRLKYADRKQNQYCNLELCKNAENSLSKSAKSFINVCLKINEKRRLQLSMLIDHEFLRLETF